MRRQDPRIKTSADKIAERVFNEAAKLPTPELVCAADAMRNAASRRFDDMLSGKLPGMTETIQ